MCDDILGIQVGNEKRGYRKNTMNKGIKSIYGGEYIIM